MCFLLIIYLLYLDKYQLLEYNLKPTFLPAYFLSMYENPNYMEPLYPGKNKALTELAINVFADASELGGMVHPVVRREITRLLRHINSYYSNRIEGEHTTPADIENAVKRKYSNDENKKRLQLLNVAHIDVQELIDGRFKAGDKFSVCSPEFLRWIHKEFYERVPEHYLKINYPDRDDYITMAPGTFRSHNVTVGNHLPPNWENVSAFMKRFEDAYSSTFIYGEKALLAAAASHHRLTWIHPFLDGNGRVTRLFTYAYMRKSGIDSYGLWSLSRGLARQEENYKRMLSHADQIRQGDLDGRGNLSEKALTDFCFFFFEVAADQISYMKKLLNLEALYNRIVGYVNLRANNALPDEKPLRGDVQYVLTEVMMRGEIARGEVPRLIGSGERTATKVIRSLLDEELLVSDSHRAPLRFHIPAKVVGYYFPDLYPAGSI